MVKGKPYVMLICAAAGLGGFLFGFDTAVISGAINFLRIQFQLSPAMEGWVMSSALSGCLAGAAAAGYLSDEYGRKKVLLASAFLFVISSVGCMAAQTPSFLVVSRMAGGIGVGFAAMVAPMFIAELSPANQRGRLVSVYQLAITLGILCSYLSNSILLNYALSHAAKPDGLIDYWFVEEVWRGMLGSNAVPALLFFLCLLFIPESPRWLVKENQKEEAAKILARINGETAAMIELSSISNSVSGEKGSFRELFHSSMRMALLIGLALPLFSQLSGITTVMYYAPSIFEKAGFNASSSAMSNAAIIGFFNMIFTLIAIWKIDNWGRKKLLMAGFFGLSLALVLIGCLFIFHADANLLLLAFILYIIIFAATLGPGVWVVLSEIFPTKIRGRAMSLGTLALFAGSALVTQTYPLLREGLGIGVAFLIYGLCIFPAGYFVYKAVPETKEKSLEEIERQWSKQNSNKN